MLSTVSKETGCPYFHAMVSFEMARLSSRKSRDRSTAMLHRQVLEAIRCSVATQPGPFEERLQRAVAEVPQLFGVDSAGLGLRFSISLSAHRWVGVALRTPSFPASDAHGLQRGLRAWRRLREAKCALLVAQEASSATAGAICSSLRQDHPVAEQAAWLVLRETLLDLEADAGFDRHRRRVRLLRAESLQAVHREKLVARRQRRSAAREEATASRAVRKIRSDLARLARVERGACRDSSILEKASIKGRCIPGNALLWTDPFKACHFIPRGAVHVC